ncbi:MAG: 50S ribosomal protein L4 [Patescibacteria group bacterium]
MTTEIYNKENQKIGAIELPGSVFSIKWNPDLVKQAITAQLANRRQPLAHAKGRGEVSGGGKKPWRQKHTGRARAGSSRSPLWKGGGVTFGPTKEKDFSRKINKKMKSLALYSLLSKKASEGEVRVIDNLSLSEYKTKHVFEIISKFFGGKSSVIFVPSRDNSMFSRAGRNIPKVLVTGTGNLDIYECASHDNLIFEKGAIEELAAIADKKK